MGQTTLFWSQSTDLVPADAVTVSCYVDAIPPFAETELTRLYGHVHSSLAFFRTSRPTDNVGTYVAWQEDKPIVLLVFRLENGTIHVLNEFIALDAAEVRRFAHTVFRAFASARAIRFPAVQAAVEALPYPYQKHNAKEDWIIDLPAQPDDYLAKLGRATRDTIKRSRRKTARDFPSLTHAIIERDAIGEDMVRGIIRLSEARIAAKKKRFGIDEAETQRILRLARECGFVSVLSIDGRLAAGMICCRNGTHCLTEVIAHDPAYNDYQLGTLCYYVTICASIARGVRTFHMGGGREAYKARFLGVRQDMDCLEIYRSWKHLALIPHRAARTALEGGLRQIKIWLLAREKSALTRGVFRALMLLDRLRRRKR